MAKGNRWTWDEEKTEAFSRGTENCKRQKLGEGVECGSDKVALLESVRKNLGERWTDDFGKSDPSDREKPTREMTKEEYQRNTENLKDWLENKVSDWRGVARILHVTTHVENPCYILRTVP